MPLQIWKPDTCGCIIEERHGEGNGVEFNRVIEKCTVHQTVPDNQLFGVLYANPDGENKRKNRLEKALIETTGLNLGELNSNGAYVWRTGLGFTWSWTGTGANRVLKVSIVGRTLTTQQRNTIQQWCDTNFGAGRIVIN